MTPRGTYPCPRPRTEPGVRPGLDAGARRRTNGMGAQMPTEKYGVRSPFHAGVAEVAAAVAAVPPRRCWTADRTRCPTRIRLRYSPPVKPLSRGRAAPTRRRRSLPNDEFWPPPQASRRIFPDPAQRGTLRPAGCGGSPELTIAKTLPQLLLVMPDVQHRVTPSAVHQSRQLGCTVESFTSGDLLACCRVRRRRGRHPRTVRTTPARPRSSGTCAPDSAPPWYCACGR